MKKVICKINNKLDGITPGKTYEILYDRKNKSNEDIYFITNDYGLIEGYKSTIFEDLDKILFKNLQIDFEVYCDERMRKCSCEQDCIECALKWCFVNYINKGK